MLEDNICEVRITDEKDVASGMPGVEVSVSKLHREFRSLEPERALQELVEVLAVYLKDYSDVSISYEGRQVDPESVIAAAHRLELSGIDNDGITHPV